MADTHIKINAVTPRVQYVGDGSTTSFPYAFAIFDDTDMVVYVGDEIIETGYTVTGAGQTEGGNVVFDTAPENGVIITLLRNVPIERVTDFQEGGTFRPKNLNDEFDRQTAFAQQVQEALTRCVKVDPTSESNPEEILPKVERLYESADNIDIVANDKANVDAVAGNATNIDAVAGNESNINTVAGISSDVSTVAGNTTDISNVATNMSDVNDCADNMEAIQDAPNQAASAAASAEAAAQSAAVSNPPPLLSYQWTDHLLNDICYLRADTFSWQSGSVYKAAYDHLVDDYTNGTSTTETVGSYTITYVLADDGHKITTDETTVANIYNESGVAWYYVLDTTNQRFKLPRELPITDKSKGNGMALGITDNSKNLGFFVHTSDWNIDTTEAAYGKTVGTTVSSVYQTANKAIGVTTDPTKSGIISHRANENGQQYLYFYVGNYNQPAIEQTAGLNSELFNGKLDLDLGNATSSTKETIVGLGVPDYASGISVSAGVFTPSASGVLVMVGDNNVNKNFHIYLGNDNTGVDIMYASVISSQGGSSWFIPMKKGTTYYINQVLTRCAFYPYLGEV